MPKIVDPDNLSQGVSVFFNYANPSARTVGVSASIDVVASLVPPLKSGSDSGVTLQALYSFCKEQWRTDNNLIKIPFPFVSITKNQFDVVNNWNFADDKTRYLIRDAGWSVRTGSSNDVAYDEWTGIVTLGSLGTTDQVYFQQSSSTEPPQNFQMSGSVNQAIKMYQSGSVSAGTMKNYKTFTKLFVREWQKTYAQASIQTDLSVATEEYTVYSLPLTNATDLKISEAVESNVNAGNYTNETIKFLSGSYFNARKASTTYAAGAVVSQSNGRWYINSGTTGVSSASTALADIVPNDGTNIRWTLYSGERQIGSGLYYPFNKIIDAGVGKTLTAAQIYTRVQYQLRQNADIDNGTDLAATTGKTADPLLRFLGDTLITYNGVYIDNFQDADTNSIDFYDVSGTVRRFPYVAAGTITFNDNLKADSSAKYYMFFSSVPSGAFGSGSATLVKDNLTAVISGSVAAASSVAFTFDYDFNTQGGRTAGTDADVTVVALGLNSAQYVSTTATLGRTKANNISLVAALERNYNNPA